MKASIFVSFAMILLTSLVAQAQSTAQAQTSAKDQTEVRVGSKAFTEGYLMGELVSQTLEQPSKTGGSVSVERKFGLGNTGITFQALQNEKIDLYVEYTGTLREAILKIPDSGSGNSSDPNYYPNYQKKLDELHLVVSKSLGFNNTYALAIPKKFAEENHLQRISDLKKVMTQLRPVFSHEFSSRRDGLNALRQRYGLTMPQASESVEHALAYKAIESGSANLIDIYSTDSQINKLGLVVLEDDLKFFPNYEAVILANAHFVAAHPEVWQRLQALEGTLSESDVRKLNAQVELSGVSFAKAIENYLSPKASETVGPVVSSKIFKRVTNRTREHLELVGITVLIATLIGIPLGILASRWRNLGRWILVASGVVQTIPSLALLCLLIPLFGIGTVPALVALFLYAVFPIVLNTYVGLTSLDSQYSETSRTLGLNLWQQLFWIELPLASRTIVAGIKTATVIGIGTATLAALIGAGGYGAPIMTGLAINNMNLVLEGALPSALMALFASFLFDALQSWITPRGLKVQN